MVHICYGCKKFEKSGKCRIRIKIRIRIPGKKFFLNFLFFNCEQFLLNKFSSKMVINPKKVCFLHFSYLPPPATRPNCIYNLCSKSGLQNGKEFDQCQVPPRKISGKKPDPENPEKNPDPKFRVFLSRFLLLYIEKG